MKSVISASALLSVFAAFLASCTPIPDPPPIPGYDVSNNPNRTDPNGTPTNPAPDGGSRSGQPDKPDSSERIDPNAGDPEPPARTTPAPSTKVARPVPGKPGFVFSPFNNKIIDVKGIPSGTLVADPTYPRSEKKYFRVP